jgi:hypothetical protein
VGVRSLSVRLKSMQKGVKWSSGGLVGWCGRGRVGWWAGSAAKPLILTEVTFVLLAS